MAGRLNNQIFSGFFGDCERYCFLLESHQAIHIMMVNGWTKNGV